MLDDVYVAKYLLREKGYAYSPFKRAILVARESVPPYGTKGLRFIGILKRRCLEMQKE